MNLVPVGDKILVKAEEAPSQTPGGIVLPDQARKSSTQGTVVAVGTGILTESGQRVGLLVNPGDKVIFQKYAGVEVEHNGETLLALTEGDLIAVVQ